MALTPPQPVTLIELEFGDTEFLVRQHPDGMYTLSFGDEGLLVDEAQFRQIVEAFERIGLGLILRVPAGDAQRVPDAGV